jgi:ribA/ribD-fused uncharacterized protein
MSDDIGFMTTRGPYGCFTNFSRHSFVLKDVEWPTSEHYYQAQKFVGTRHESEIRKQKGPGAAARAGRSRDRPLRKDWEAVKDDVMMDAIRAKFTQNPKCKEVLLSTGDARIFENSKVDYYWGVGKSGTGKNMLGKLLMKLREEFREQGS